MKRLNWDTLNWRDLIKEGYGIPPLIGAVAATEPDRWIEVRMTYADLLFLKGLTDEAVANKHCPTILPKENWQNEQNLCNDFEEGSCD